MRVRRNSGRATSVKIGQLFLLPISNPFSVRYTVPRNFRALMPIPDFFPAVFLRMARGGLAWSLQGWALFSRLSAADFEILSAVGVLALQRYSAAESRKRSLKC